MHPTLFQIGDFRMPSYSFFLGIGLLIAIVVSIYRVKKYNGDFWLILDMAFYVAVMALFGSHLYYLILHTEDYSWENPMKTLFITGGLVYQGGLIFGFITAVVYLFVKKINILQYFDIISPTILIGEAIARIGCFLGGCCFGKKCDNFLGVSFPQESVAGKYQLLEHYEKIWPTQLMSSVILFISFAFLLVIEKKIDKIGLVFVLSVILSSSIRFIIDFIRYYESDSKIFLFSHSQLAALIFAVLAILTYTFFSKPYRKVI